MDLTEAICGRRSIRRFTEESVPLGRLVKLVQAGTWHPLRATCNHGDLQSWTTIECCVSSMLYASE
jgi:hypothetical protein